MVLDLYKLACRSFDPFNAAVSFSEAFDGCLALNGVDIILQRCRVLELEDRWIGRFFGTMILDAFYW